MVPSQEAIMNIITVTSENLASEHICCAITDKKGESCVSSKKAWMKARFEDGLVFKKLDARGKIFIEYIPAEKAWYPISANGYMHIDCFWVSGQFKGAKQGNISEKGMVLYYTNQCPHTAKYAPIIKELAEGRGTTVKLVKIETMEQAQNAPAPFATYSFFFDGQFVTNEIFGEKKFGKFMDDKYL
jgi:hypothetical protein